MFHDMHLIFQHSLYITTYKAQYIKYLRFDIDADCYRLSDANDDFLAFVGSVVDQAGDFLLLTLVFL